MSAPLVEVKDLRKDFPVKAGPFGPRLWLPAVNGVSFSIRKGETLGLVGESGCGKSTLGRCLLKLIPPTAGEIYLDGASLTALSRSAMKPYRRRLQMIFQDPYSSLNPRMTVGQLLEEPLVIHQLSANAKARRERVKELLSLVGLSSDSLSRYPHEFSGGQRQRIGIARSLAVEPEFIVCDEPVSALDVSIQAQILNLLMELQQKLGLTYLFISHDLRIVEHLSHRVAVMYLGKIVEMGDAREICASPKHPYTRALVASVRHLRGIEAYLKDRQCEGDWLTCEQAAKLLRVHGKTVRRAAARKELPALRPLPNGPWIFAHSDIVAAMSARHAAGQTDRRRRIQGADRSSNQLTLEIPNTSRGDAS